MHNKYTNDHSQISAILEYLINILRQIYPPIIQYIYILSAIIICVIQ